MNPIRTLTAREIECRVSQIKKTGLQLLLYKDARCDMAILDEAFGPMNWQRKHSRDNANCTVSIWDSEKGCWVEKEDTGTESNTEAEKGLASDSFKRACVNVGIGRELYTAPFIWVTPPNCEIKENNGRFQCFDRFEVKEIGYNDHREINRLIIANAKTGNVVYEYGRGAAKAPTSPVQPASATPKPAPAPTAAAADSGHSGPPTATQLQYIKDNASDPDYMDIMTQYGANLEAMTYDDALEVIEMIDKHKITAPCCERCNSIITGIALPNGTTMTASELIGKSKLTYGGIFCYSCMKVLDKKRKAEAKGA